MRLRFNLGAIVKFYLLDGTSESGKVINVYPDEVELLEQFKIVKRDHSYDPCRTGDGTKVTHLNRQLIKSWEYASAMSFENRVYEDGSDFWNRYTFSELTTFNNYSEDGFCKGTGSWCGDIADEDVHILIPPINVDSDGMEDGLELMP